MAILPELHCSQDFVKEKKKVYIHYGKEKIYYLFIHSFIQHLSTHLVPGIVLRVGISNGQSPCSFRFYIVEKRRIGYKEINR